MHKAQIACIAYSYALGVGRDVLHGVNEDTALRAAITTAPLVHNIPGSMRKLFRENLHDIYFSKVKPLIENKNVTKTALDTATSASTNQPG